jgi:RimJ/RimL family protein N-acetyltransferase
LDVTLHTPRLILRPSSIDDAGRVARFLDNFGVAGNLSRVPYPYRLADAKAWLRTRNPQSPASETSFILDLPGEGAIGVVGFHRDVEGTVIGYWLAQPFWSRGFMSEAVRACLDWYFTETAAMALASGVFHFNKPSLAIQKKMGFTEIGTSMRLCLARGEEVRHIDTELTRAAWMAHRQAAQESSK